MLLSCLKLSSSKYNHTHTYMHIYLFTMVTPIPPCKYNHTHILMMVTPYPTLQRSSSCVPREWPEKLNYWILEYMTCRVVSGNTEQRLSRVMWVSWRSCPSAVFTQLTALPGQNLWYTSGIFFHALPSPQNHPNIFISLLHWRHFPSGTVALFLFSFIYLIYDKVLPYIWGRLWTSGAVGMHHHTRSALFILLKELNPNKQPYSSIVWVFFPMGGGSKNAFVSFFPSEHTRHIFTHEHPGMSCLRTGAALWEREREKACLCCHPH